MLLFLQLFRLKKITAAQMPGSQQKAIYRLQYEIVLGRCHHLLRDLIHKIIQCLQQCHQCASSDLKTAQYVDISCATAAASFDDSSEINLVVYR